MGEQATYDLCVIGGGINGAGIARDAAGRGLSVLLLEQGDLAGATSSASTKLIHGGLRYLEYGEFGLVRHALAEREVLLNLAPHIISPMRFILPHDKGLRPAWMIRLGLFLYDHLARRDRLPGSHMMDLKDSPLKDRYKKGFRYADCWVDDARLVVLNAVDAAARGADIRTRTACIGLRAHPDGQNWDITMQDGKTATARMIVNAAGPWVRQVLDEAKLAGSETPGVRLVKGSHIIVPRQFDGDDSYILQQPDKRIVFAIPYEQDFTLIGTTDVEYKDDPAKTEIDENEINYLCTAFNHSFEKQITPEDIIRTYSGVRPLLDDGDDSASAVTRDYRLVLDHSHGPALLSVFGGKITTYRHLAEEAVDLLCGNHQHWTAAAPLPGGDIENADFENFVAAQTRKYQAFPQSLIRRYAGSYGTKMDEIIGTAKTVDALGTDYGGGLHEAEIRYLIRHEWAQSADDILWRRTKLGLHTGPETRERLENFLRSTPPMSSRKAL
ncbi:MAG: glycerol-3-phosphate dehydrogenase [Rhodospirillales bacterium]|nr:glycerol-3-phosphate dehydrogenase [Rhodospirillales bacterium]MCB9995013.1 glycerol-3-phosphate dehydrogenase [Rhodospirillales bacterium]